MTGEPSRYVTNVTEWLIVYAQGAVRSELDRMIARRDPNGPGGLFPEIAHCGKFGIDLRKPRSHGVHQAFARFGEGDATCLGSEAERGAAFRADGLSGSARIARRQASLPLL